MADGEAGMADCAACGSQLTVRRSVDMLAAHASAAYVLTPF